MPVLIALLAVSSAAAPVPLHVGVADFRTTPPLTPLAGALSGLVANELQRMGAFTVTSAAQVREQLSLERQKQLLGCGDDVCQSAVVNALGFDFLVAGNLTRVGQRLSLELLLLEQKNGTRTGSEVITGANESALMDGVSPAVARLVGKLLKERSGTLVVVSSEAGSVLKVDDVAVGTTPLQGRMQVAGGPHFLSLEKDGFTAWKKEVRISADQLTEENVHLAPSPDFISAYESKQRKLRFGAWATSGLTVAAVAAAIAFEVHAGALYGSRESVDSFVWAREKVTAGDEGYRSQLNQRRSEVGSAQDLSHVFTAVAAVGAVGACVFWLLGEDPNRYGAYREVGLKAGLAVGPNGGFASLSGGW